MKIMVLLCFVFAFAMVSFGQTPIEICPKHFEAPTYPAIARTAHIQGEVPVRVTIDANGTVSDVEAPSNNPAIALLWRASVENAKTWIFSKPRSLPYTLTITYDYQFDKSLPVDYTGDKEVTKIVFDLPGRVEILANERMIVEPGTRKHSVQRKRD